MGFKKFIKSKSFATVAGMSVSVLLVAGAGVGIYYGVTAAQNASNNNSTSAVYVDTNVSNDEWKRFSRNNSFRIQLQTSDPSGNSIQISEGTAWSWYYQPTPDNQFYEWYLLTNFHVVASTLEYAKTKVNNPLIGEFNSNQSVLTIGPNLFIDLGFCNINLNDNQCYPNQDEYNSIIREPTQKSPLFSKAEIISDNQIEGLDLFSANENSQMQNYNLDMALVKFEFNKQIVDPFINSQKWNNLKFTPSRVANPYDNYLKANNNNKLNNDNSLSDYKTTGNETPTPNVKQIIQQNVNGNVGQELKITTTGLNSTDNVEWFYQEITNNQIQPQTWNKFTNPPVQDDTDPNVWIFIPQNQCKWKVKVNVNNNSYESNTVDFVIDSTYYIAGNPGSCNRLVFNQTNTKSFGRSLADYEVDKNSPRIRQPIYLHSLNVSNWKLTAGASGSAVYKITSNVDLFTSYPFGVYWGGYGSDNNFRPAFTPLVVNKNEFIINNVASFEYNVYDNFTNYLRATIK